MTAKRFITVLVAFLATVMPVCAQRTADVLDRGLVAMKTGRGVFCSWRLMGEEYYGVVFNLYRDGVKLNAEPLTTSNYTDAQGTEGSTYTVRAVVNGQEQAASRPATVWAHNYRELRLTHDGLTSTFEPNDACAADLDGDGELELLVKCWNLSDAALGYPPSGNNGEYDVIEVLKLDGTRLWWIDCGPNLADFQHNETNIAAFDWDGDGKAEALMRAADGTMIHLSDGTTQVIGDRSKNYRAPGGSSGQWFVHDGDEFLVYMDGTTGRPWQVTEYPLHRLEPGENSLNAAWGDGYGHRSTKHFFGAPYLDGRRPSIFLARGIYTRHKMVAIDVNPATHELTERWRWTCNEPGSPWYGNGYHNYLMADVDWDGRDEIVFGSMVIDDNGHGLSTTGLGHGDAQHVGDFNPYMHGQEYYGCNEDRPDNNYRDATTSKIYYRKTSGNDDGRAMCGNFTNLIPGCLAASGHDSPISTVVNDHVEGIGGGGFDLNFRIYWDGDLLEETVNGMEVRNSTPRIMKYGTGIIARFNGTLTNNDTKATPCLQADLFGDWREELVLRTTDNNIRIYTTEDETPWRNYTLWHDMQYRQAMVWQMCGYNQPPHASYFLGELEGITMAPPPLTETGRNVVANGQTIGSAMDGKHVLLAETSDMTVAVADGAQPAIVTVNAPSWVQGHDDNNNITTEYFTHTLTGGAFAGAMRLVKQGDGLLQLPNVTEQYSGSTDVWAGTLLFDGTMANSRVWLNRFATLSSNGGHFNKGIQMDYASSLLPGGKDNRGEVEADSLILNFGARVVFDVYSDGTQADFVKARVLTIEKKDWQYGPTYNTPVFQVVPHYADGQTALSEGRYLLAQAEVIKGNYDDIQVEGVGAQKASLVVEDGKIYLDIQGLRDATNVTWTGTQGSDWDLADSENFVSTATGEDNIFVTGDKVTFDDTAVNTDVVIKQPVSPSAVLFANDVKEYTLRGDSIVGTGSLTKTGSANVNIMNLNTYSGGTFINGGRITVASLANAEGVAVGALGGLNNSITLRNGGELASTGNIATSQPIVLGSGGGGICVEAGQTFATTGAITSNVKGNLVKTGAGTLKLGSLSKFNAIYLERGTLQGSENGSSIHQYPDTVVINGGVMRDANSIYSYSNSNVNVDVPEGKEGSWYMDERCNYHGSLNGGGTITVYATGPRAYLQGNWSQFTGILNARGEKTGSYDPEFTFDNSYGMRFAHINTDVRISNSGKNFAIGGLSGKGTLAGGGRYTIGARNEDITWTGKLEGCLITKVGSGTWSISTIPTSIGTGNIEVKGGVLNINHSAANQLFFGNNQVVASDTGIIAGRAYLESVYLQKGGTIKPGSFTSNYPVGSIKVKNSLYAYPGSHVSFFIYNAKNTSSSRSYLEIGSTFSLAGDIEVTMKNYTPKEGDEIILWTAKNFTGTPTAISLPDLSEYGLEWDTSELFQPEGKLKVVNAGTAIKQLPAETVATCSVYTVNGVHVATFTARRADVERMTALYGKGTYIVRMTSGNMLETRKIIVKK